MNAALKNATGEIFIRIDDDVIASPEWLESIVHTFDTIPKVGGVTGPTVIPPDHLKARDLFYFQGKFLKGAIYWRVIGIIYYRFFMEGKPFALGKWYGSGAFSLGSNLPSSTTLEGPVEVMHHEACNMAVRRDLLVKVGGFDPKYGGSGEFHEPDASFKITRIGYKILFDPAAAVNHLPSTDGYFRARSESYSRVVNFVNFYFSNIRLDEFGKGIRFVTYLLFLNTYWLFIFLTTKNRNQLGAFRGTIEAIIKNTFLVRKNRRVACSVFNTRGGI